MAAPPAGGAWNPASHGGPPPAAAPVRMTSAQLLGDAPTPAHAVRSMLSTASGGAHAVQGAPPHSPPLNPGAPDLRAPSSVTGGGGAPPAGNVPVQPPSLAHDRSMQRLLSTELLRTRTIPAEAMEVNLPQATAVRRGDRGGAGAAGEQNTDVFDLDGGANADVKATPTANSVDVGHDIGRGSNDARETRSPAAATTLPTPIPSAPKSGVRMSSADLLADAPAMLPSSTGAHAAAVAAAANEGTALPPPPPPPVQVPSATSSTQGRGQWGTAAGGGEADAWAAAAAAPAQQSESQGQAGGVGAIPLAPAPAPTRSWDTVDAPPHATLATTTDAASEEEEVALLVRTASSSKRVSRRDLMQGAGGAEGEVAPHDSAAATGAVGYGATGSGDGDNDAANAPRGGPMGALHAEVMKPVTDDEPSGDRGGGGADADAEPLPAGAVPFQPIGDALPAAGAGATHSTGSPPSLPSPSSPFRKPPALAQPRGGGRQSPRHQQQQQATRTGRKSPGGARGGGRTSPRSAGNSSRQASQAAAARELPHAAVGLAHWDEELIDGVEDVHNAPGVGDAVKQRLAQRLRAAAHHGGSASPRQGSMRSVMSGGGASYGPSQASVHRKPPKRHRQAAMPAAGAPRTGLTPADHPAHVRAATPMSELEYWEQARGVRLEEKAAVPQERERDADDDRDGAASWDSMDCGTQMSRSHGRASVVNDADFLGRDWQPRRPSSARNHHPPLPHAHESVYSQNAERAEVEFWERHRRAFPLDAMCRNMAEEAIADQQQLQAFARRDSLLRPPPPKGMFDDSLTTLGSFVRGKGRQVSFFPSVAGDGEDDEVALYAQFDSAPEHPLRQYASSRMGSFNRPVRVEGEWAPGGAERLPTYEAFQAGLRAPTPRNWQPTDFADWNSFRTEQHALEQDWRLAEGVSPLQGEYSFRVADPSGRGAPAAGSGHANPPRRPRPMSVPPPPPRDAPSWRSPPSHHNTPRSGCIKRPPALREEVIAAPAALPHTAVPTPRSQRSAGAEPTRSYPPPSPPRDPADAAATRQLSPGAPASAASHRSDRDRPQLRSASLPAGRAKERGSATPDVRLHGTAAPPLITKRQPSAVPVAKVPPHPTRARPPASYAESSQPQLVAKAQSIPSVPTLPVAAVRGELGSEQAEGAAAPAATAPEDYDILDMEAVQRVLSGPCEPTPPTTDDDVPLQTERAQLESFSQSLTAVRQQSERRAPSALRATQQMSPSPPPPRATAHTPTVDRMTSAVQERPAIRGCVGAPGFDEPGYVCEVVSESPPSCPIDPETLLDLSESVMQTLGLGVLGRGASARGAAAGERGAQLQPPLSEYQSTSLPEGSASSESVVVDGVDVVGAAGAGARVQTNVAVAPFEPLDVAVAVAETSEPQPTPVSTSDSLLDPLPPTKAEVPPGYPHMDADGVQGRVPQYTPHASPRPVAPGRLPVADSGWRGGGGGGACGGSRQRNHSSGGAAVPLRSAPTKERPPLAHAPPPPNSPTPYAQCTGVVPDMLRRRRTDVPAEAMVQLMDAAPVLDVRAAGASAAPAPTVLVSAAAPTLTLLRAGSTGAALGAVDAACDTTLRSTPPQSRRDASPPAHPRRDVRTPAAGAGPGGSGEGAPATDAPRGAEGILEQRRARDRETPHAARVCGGYEALGPGLGGAVPRGEMYDAAAWVASPAQRQSQYRPLPPSSTMFGSHSNEPVWDGGRGGSRERDRTQPAKYAVTGGERGAPRVEPTMRLEACPEEVYMTQTTPGRGYGPPSPRAAPEGVASPIVSIRHTCNAGGQAELNVEVHLAGDKESSADQAPLPDGPLPLPFNHCDWAPGGAGTAAPHPDADAATAQQLHYLRALHNQRVLDDRAYAQAQARVFRGVQRGA